MFPSTEDQGVSAGDMPGACARAIRDHLASLLSHPDFQSSARRKQLLTYIVEQTLDGNGARLKGFELAVAVLGRDQHFDPQTDTIIRVEISKLRKELEAFYQTAALSDAVRIEIPRGRYVPIFHGVTASADAAPDGSAPAAVPAPPAVAPDPAAPVPLPPSRAREPGRRRLWLGVGLALAVCAVVAMMLWRHLASERTQLAGPIVVVTDFKASDETGGPIATGLTNALVSDLMRFDDLQVFFGQSIDRWDQDTTARLAGVPVFLVSGNVDRGDTDVRTSARLTDFKSGRVIWSRSFLRPLNAAAMLDVQDEMAGAIASQLAQTYGLINHDTGQRIAQGRPTSLFAYECVQKAFQYRLTFEKALYAPMRACLQEATGQDPGYADAWTMLAFAHLDAVRLHHVALDQTDAEMDAALIAAQKGVELGPERARPLQALSAVRFMRGEFAEAERLQRRAIALNPNNPESLAQLGWRFAVRGQPEDAIDLLQQAIHRSLVIPAWYHTTLAVAYLDSGARDLAYAQALQGQGFCCGLGKVMLAITAAEKDRLSEAKTVLEAAIAEEPMIAQDPDGFWASWNVEKGQVSRLNAGLAKARGAGVGARSPGVEDVR